MTDNISERRIQTLLAIETSGPVGSLALRIGGRCVEERFLSRFGGGHAQTLVPEAIALLARQGLRPTDLTAIAVSIGPGSFTGLRIGVTFAKLLAYATGARLAAVETFRVVAENVPGEREVLVLADAQRGGVIAGRYRRVFGSPFAPDGPPGVVSLAELPTRLAAADLLTGAGVGRLTALPAGIRVAPPRSWLPRASAVARLGEADLAADGDADPWTLEPLYVRKSGAEEKAEVQKTEAVR